jgi:hypothetical protein
MKKRFKWFLLGGLFYISINSLAQDIIGKEAYIERVRDYWVPAAVSIPLAIVGIIFVLIYRVIEVIKKEFE